MPDEIQKSHSRFLYIMLGGCLITIFVSFYAFYFKKDYDFFVETQCDPEVETCFFRDCEASPDDCPPNGFSYYNEYTISAKDFSKCENEDCTEACSTGLIQCEKTECTEQDLVDEICIAPSVGEEN
ncbi:MAG: hypothetical protein WC662_01310 [Candidatus Paceibacterota bacterium]|jgi:hypothetical protein